MKFLSKLLFLATVAMLGSVGVIAKHAQALTFTPIRIELKGDPGETITQKITLINETKTKQSYYPSFANFEAQGEDGNPTFVEPVDGLGTWMSVNQSETILEPGETTIIPITIKIPSNATPGGYFAGVFWGTVPPAADGQSQVAIGAKTGPLILLSVNGEVQKSANIIGFDTKDAKHFYTALPVEMTYKFQNTGGDRVKPKGTVAIRNILGIKAKTLDANMTDGNVLPKQVRRFDVEWKKRDDAKSQAEIGTKSFKQQVSYEWHNFALGYFSANLAVTSTDGTTVDATAKTNFIVFPWHLLIVILILLLIVTFLFKKMLRNYNKWVIGQAEMALSRQHESKQRKTTNRV